MSTQDKDIRFRNLIVDWSQTNKEGLPYCVIPKGESVAGKAAGTYACDLLIDSIFHWGEDDMYFFLEKFQREYEDEAKDVINTKESSAAEVRGAQIIYALLRNDNISPSDVAGFMKEYYETPDIHSLEPSDLISAWIQWDES